MKKHSLKTTLSPHSNHPLCIPYLKMSHKFRGFMAISFYDPTMLGIKRVKRPFINEMDILQSINRNTGQQFQTISEITEHLTLLKQQKLLTD